MLKDITMGQYFPINSFLHKLDPRTKILIFILEIVAIFMAKTVYSYVLLSAFTLMIMLISKVPVKMYLKGLKPILYIIVFTALLNLFLTKGEEKIVLFGFSTGITVEGVIVAVNVLYLPTSRVILV